MQQKKDYRNKRRRPVAAKKKVVPTIDPRLLQKAALIQDYTPFESKLTFEDFSLSPQVKDNIDAKGYTRPTEIQEKAIPHLLEGKNLIGVAATGTGKTGAFLIPMVERFLHEPRTMALVVVPTRELAQQVHEEFESLTKGMDFSSACLIGGTNVVQDIQIARQANRLIVGTPGRLNDLMDRKALRLNHTSILVLDEFDRMLDMGFIRDIRKIVDSMTGRKQTLLFSATVDRTQEGLIKEMVNNPIKVNVTDGQGSSDSVEQDVIHVNDSQHKFEVLVQLLNDASCEKAILFAETKRLADRIGKKLQKSGLNSAVIHGDKSQNYRTKAIQSFKAGKTKILVATDVAARGIDVDDVTHVVNYDVPRTMDSYIHRIGRTGRAGKTGKAYTLVSADKQ
jgi:ATP-dependent RNA helicase RhlE